MRRSSFAGPLFLILIGFAFLIHQISPQFDIPDLFAHYWPYLLICWGTLQVIEILFRASRGEPIPTNGVSGGAWFAVVLICLFGLATFEFRRPNTWWHRANFISGVEMFGQEHDYTVPTVQKSIGSAPRIVIERFRGDAKIVGNAGNDLVLTGHKTVRSYDPADADRANRDTPVEVLVTGNTVTIRCHQDNSGNRIRVTTDLELNVPKGASVEATGTVGDFEITSLTGDVDISIDNAGVRLQNIDGNVKLDTRKSDMVHCADVKGTVDLRGHGSDVELNKIAGQVSIEGDYKGTLSLRDLAKPVRVQNARTQLNVQQVPGQIRLDRGSLNVEDVVGPVKVNTRATDVVLSGFTDGLDLTVDKGDVDLKPSRTSLGKMTVHTRAGNIDLTLPRSASFNLDAETSRGEIDNECGDELREQTRGRGAHLDGNVGAGPSLHVTTDRGDITVRKTEVVAAGPKV